MKEKKGISVKLFLGLQCSVDDLADFLELLMLVNGCLKYIIWWLNKLFDEADRGFDHENITFCYMPFTSFFLKTVITWK